jgi:hypothetical protein
LAIPSAGRIHIGLRNPTEAISLFPSIGNWSYPCGSHYWIERNRIRWAPAWTDLEIEEARCEDEEMRARYYREGGLYDWRDRLHDDVPDE